MGIPELRLLRAFVEVAERLSFTRAAEELHVSQQSVSRMVRDLERELGVRLLERTTRAIRVTEAGEVLLEQGRGALQAAAAAFEAARSIGAARQVVHVATTAAIGAADRLDTVAALRQDDPMLSIEFHAVRPEDLASVLARGRVHLALMRTAAPSGDRLDSVELRPSPAIACMPVEHPLAGRPSLHAADLRGERLLLPDAAGTPYATMLLAILEAAGVAVRPVPSRVLGSEVHLAEVVREAAVALAPAGAGCPDRTIGVPVVDLALPMRMVWAGPRPRASVDRLIRAMGLHPIAPVHPLVAA